ncbi:fibronectin type III domain-containing protein [Paenibacillus aceti]|uniref:S-layer protein n=1 Tax=Paenibacillus aceti TaxID=1820010 RepID=A0ABQ1W4V0_9BACL|nr:fibronectin type III domain-containing protein [Paenibacillus aceti]GGG15147.1 hypothetical protein GCM10010913_41300 [Paenibacillus aceti]
MFRKSLIFLISVALFTSTLLGQGPRAFADEKVQISIKADPKIDIALAAGSTNLELSNFEQDLKAKLAAKGVDANQLQVQALEMKSMTAEDTFDWQIYDHINYPEPYGNSLYRHIIVSNKDISFYGYTDKAHKDFMFMPDSSAEKKTFTFEVLEQKMDWHTLEGAGFLFNATINNGYVSGYVILFGQTEIKLFELNQVNVELLRNGTYNSLANAGRLVSTFPRLAVTSHQVKIEVTPTSINMWDNNQVLINNYTLTSKYGNGFGPFASYTSHGCSSVSSFTFKNIKMETKKPKQYREVLLQPIWREGSDRFIVNVDNHVISDLNSTTASGEILTRMINNAVDYVAIGSSTNQEQANAFITRNNGNGVFINGSSYSTAIDQLANYIFTKIRSNGSSQYMILDEDNHLEVNPSSFMKNTQTPEFPNGRWKIEHDSTYYENSTGQAQWSGRWQKDLPLKFDKPGRYEIWFGEDHPTPQYLYVHRRPVADFTLKVTKGTSNYTITVNNQSYDLDMESTPTKGIAQTEWKWRETTATTWTDGMIPGNLPLGKDYLVQLRVLDYQGAWSQPMVCYVSTGSTALKPIADFRVPDQVTKYKTLEIQDHSYDPAGRNITQRVWSIKREGTEIYSGSTMISNFLAYGAGEYTISLKVLNDANLWSDVFQRHITVTEDLSAPKISFSPSDATWTSDPVSVTIHYFDDSGLSNKYYKVTQSNQTPSSWDTAKDIENITLTNEGQWYIHAKAQDIAGKETTISAGPYQLQLSPDIPVLKLNSIGENWSEIGWSLPNHSLGDGYQYKVENITTGRSWLVNHPTDHIREEGLAAGSIYQYRIKAVNHVGESEWSEQFEVLTLPAPVDGLKVSFVPNNSGTVNVSFDDVESAVSYQLTIKEGSDIVYEEELNTAGTHQVTGLEGGKQYTVIVTAHNASGAGQSSVLGFLSLPAAPGEFQSVQIRETEVELSWTASPTAALYEVLRDAVSRYSGSDLSFTDTGLKSGTEYDYSISAKNESGFGDIAYLNGVLTLPGKTKITVDEIGKDVVNFSIDTVRGAEKYVVLVNGVKEKELAPETKQFEIDSLNSGTEYTFEVYAENRSGTGVANRVTVRTLPDKPGELLITDISDTTAKLSWQPVIGADKYKVTVTDDVYFETSGTDISLSDLRAGGKYQLKVQAGNASGYGEAAAKTLLTLPASPDVRIDNVQATQFTLAWNEVISATKYVVHNEQGEIIGETKETSYTIKNLKPGSTHTVYVSAVNETGEGKKSSFTQRTLPGEWGIDPNDPQSSQPITVGDRDEHSVVIVIDPVEGADQYKIVDDAGNVVGIITAPETAKEIGGLESAKEYDNWSIIPINDVGEGQATPVPPFVTLPSSNFEVSVGNPTTSSLTVTVDSQLTDEIFVYAVNGKEVHRGKEKSYTASNLSSDKGYTFTVWTENSAGDKTKPKSATGKTLPIPSSGGSSLLQPKPPVDEKEATHPNTAESQTHTDQAGFEDIERSFAKEEILALYAKGIVKGVSDSKFEPDRQVTRVEFASLLVRALELQEASDAALTFEDIQRTAWYAPELSAAVLNGVAKGISVKEFRPLDPITREQAAKMTANAVYKGNVPVAQANYKDKDSIAWWAKPEVAALSTERVITGYPDQTFKPKRDMTRAECAALIYRALRLYQ